MKSFDFSGKRVLVTGASHGIGFGVARRFAETGADLAVLSSTADIEEAAHRIGEETGGSVKPLVCDITDREAVRRTVGGLGRLDVLVNNAGLELITPMSEPGAEVEATFERIIAINVVGTYYVTREALPLMGKGSSILITSSIWGKTGAADFAAYVTSKHANIGFMRVLAKELGPKGIRVNAVCPGSISGPMFERTLNPEQAEADRAAMIAIHPLGRLGEPAEVADAVVFLASPQASYCTGVLLPVDGGRLA